MAGGEQILRDLRVRTPEMVEALRALVEAESPSADEGACRACADVAAGLAADLLGSAPERLESGGRVHLRLGFGAPARVLLIGHLDTVWPLGTLARWPFEERNGRATGPGIFDMKAGVVQLLFALSALGSREGVVVLLTTDEEIGSPTARPLIEETATAIEAALVLEPSAAGALKTERKGVALYELEVSGRAAHAGLDPGKGANAAVELAHQLLAVAALARPELGTTVTPTLVTAGTAANTVPARAAAHVDVRVSTSAEEARVAAGFAKLRPVTPRTSLTVERSLEIPPLERRASAELFGRAQALAAGLGAVGDHAHAEGEYVEIGALAERAALVAALVQDLLR
jgi:glutamate carboxypeptidase